MFKEIIQKYGINLILILTPLITSTVELKSVKGAVGRATPCLTGAINESAVSQSSSTESFINAWKTLLHLTNGCDMLFRLKMEMQVLL